MLWFVAAVAFAEPTAPVERERVRVDRAGAWRIRPDDAPGSVPGEGPWRPVQGEALATSGAWIQARFAAGDFDVDLWVARADCARLVARSVILRGKPTDPEPDPKQPGVMLFSGTDVAIGEVAGDFTAVTFAEGAVRASGWVPTAALDEVWTEPPPPEELFGDLQASGPISLRASPGGPVLAELGVGADRRWVLARRGDPDGRYTQAVLAVDGLVARGFVRTRDVYTVTGYGFGYGSGHGGFGCADCTLVRVPAGTQVRPMGGGEPFARTAEGGEVVLTAPPSGGVARITVQTAWGPIPGEVPCAVLAGSGATQTCYPPG